MDAQLLRDLLFYDPANGVFTWNVRRGRQAVGTVARTRKDNGYLQIRLNGTIYLAHRLAWLYVTSEWPREEIDHQNRIRDDNRFENLRQASRRDNAVNARRKNNATGTRGVYHEHRTGKFYSQIRIGGGKRQHLGTFATLEAAIAARKKAEVQFHGAFVPA